jgi:hypothetical protein
MPHFSQLQRKLSVRIFRSAGFQPAFLPRQPISGVVEPKKAVLRAKVLAANVMAIKSFAAFAKSSGAFARSQSHHGPFSA